MLNSTFLRRVWQQKYAIAIVSDLSMQTNHCTLNSSEVQCKITADRFDLAHRTFDQPQPVYHSLMNRTRPKQHNTGHMQMYARHAPDLHVSVYCRVRVLLKSFGDLPDPL